MKFSKLWFNIYGEIVFEILLTCTTEELYQNAELLDEQLAITEEQSVLKKNIVGNEWKNGVRR